MKHTVDDCAMYRDDWNGLQRHEQRIFVWIAGAQDEDPWEYNIDKEKVLFHILSEVFMPLCRS